MNYTKAFSGFSVDDLAKAKEFYGQTLGVKLTESKEGLDLDLTGTHVFIYPKPNHAPATFTVLNFIVDNIEQTVDGLTALGVKFEIYDSANLKTNEKGIADGEQGPKIAWFKDPAGNFLSIIEQK